MGLLDGAMQGDRQAFFDADGFGESATLRLPSGTTRTVTVVVDRNVPPTQDEWDQGVREVMQVEIPNDATYGVTSAEVNQGKHRIDLSFRPGETAKTYNLGAPSSIDAAHLVFRVK